MQVRDWCVQVRLVKEWHGRKGGVRRVGASPGEDWHGMAGMAWKIKQMEGNNDLSMENGIKV
jgi:hypothetical protein